MGLIAQPDAGTAVTDNQLQKIISGIEAKIKPADMDAYQRIVAAGMKVMFSQATHALMVKALQSGPDPSQAVGSGIANLIAVLFKESNQTMPLKEAIPASVTLMAHALDYAEKTMGLQVTSELIADCTQTTVQFIMQRFGISKGRLNTMVANAHSMSQNPQVAAQLKQGA